MAAEASAATMGSTAAALTLPLPLVGWYYTSTVSPPFDKGSDTVAVEGPLGVVLERTPAVTMAAISAAAIAAEGIEISFIL